MATYHVRSDLVGDRRSPDHLQLGGFRSIRAGSNLELLPNASMIHLNWLPTQRSHDAPTHRCRSCLSDWAPTPLSSSRRAVMTSTGGVALLPYARSSVIISGRARQLRIFSSPVVETPGSPPTPPPTQFAPIYTCHYVIRKAKQSQGGGRVWAFLPPTFHPPPSSPGEGAKPGQTHRLLHA